MNYIEEVLDTIFRENIQGDIDENIIYYDTNLNGRPVPILAKRRERLYKYVKDIEKNFNSKRYDKIEQIIIEFIDYIIKYYYKSTVNDFRDFDGYNKSIESLINNFKYVLNIIERIKVDNPVRQAFHSYPKNFKEELFSKYKMISSIDSIDSFVSSNSSEEKIDFNYGDMRKNVKKLKKFLGLLIPLVKKNKTIETLKKTNPLKKNYNKLYERVIKLLEKNKEKKVITILKKIKEIKIIKVINDFLEHLNKLKEAFIKKFTNSGILVKFYSLTLKEKKDNF